MLVLLTVVALLVPASALLLHQYRHRTLAPADTSIEGMPDQIRELPKAA